MRTPRRTARTGTASKANRIRAAGYLRVSTAREDMQADAIYREQITRYAEAHGLQLLETFQDIGWSGRKGSPRRPQFEEMLARAEAGEFDTIIVPKLSRFGRSMRDNLDAYDRLEAAGVGIAFLDLGADTTTPAGKLIRNIMSALAEWESDLISERWKDTHAYLARNGRPSGQAAYGYRYDPAGKQLIPNPAEARVVREIFRRYSAGEGLRAIGRDLEARGIRGQRGAIRWAPSLGYLLENPTYIGLREWDGELIEGTWKPIIDRGLWDGVQVLRRASTAGHPAAGKGSARAMLSGLLVCGECGALMWHLGERYRCSTFLRGRGCRSNAIKAAKAETFVAGAFLERLTERHRASAQVRGASGLGDLTPDDRDAAIEAELRHVDRQIQALVALRLRSPGPGFDEAYRRQAAELEGRRDQLEAHAASRTLQEADAKRRAGQREKLLALVVNLPALWERASTEERQRMLELAIAGIRVVRGPNNVKSLDVEWLPWLSSASG